MLDTLVQEHLDQFSNASKILDKFPLRAGLARGLEAISYVIV